MNPPKVSKASENIRIAISIYHLLSVLLASFPEQDSKPLNAGKLYQTVEASY
jgi:hypothetical protein